MTEQPPRIPPADSAFFQEWNARRPGQTRSIARARALIEQLGLSRPAAATLVVVGSKGKGTTAIYASAYLAAAGLRTVTVTSPSLLDTTERIRTDGIAIAEHELIRLGESLSSASAPPPGYPADPSTDGYLSPGGLFTIAGLLHAAEIGAQAIVIEAGRGGSSDEVSLIPADVVAIAPIFSEHLAELGGTLVAIAQDKCGVIGQATAAVVSAPQSREVLASIQTAVTRRCHGRCQLDLVGEAAVAEVSSHLLPAGIGRDNALLGCLAARHLAAPHPVASTRTERPSRAALDQTLGSVSLPGRLSLHQVRG
ncbi:MAG: hypothetical protein JXA67_19695, partial [Micromonosporaceae bacterium]|nr:hypothetical protein [Micromonosporaceae bacterium]